MVERIVFKGRTAEQAEKLGEKDFDRLITSRARRRKRRNFLSYRALIEKVSKTAKSGSP